MGGMGEIGKESNAEGKESNTVRSQKLNWGLTFFKKCCERLSSKTLFW